MAATPPCLGHVQPGDPRLPDEQRGHGAQGVTIDPNLPVHPTFLYESIWCFVGLFLLVRYLKKRRFAGDIALRYLVWYGAGRFWIEASARQPAAGAQHRPAGIPSWWRALPWWAV